MSSEVQLSPGPLKVSDLDRTSPASPSSEFRGIPRKLEPIDASSVPSKKKKRKRRSQKASVQAGAFADSSPGDLLGESSLNQLRSRLDPLYNPPDLSLVPDHSHEQQQQLQQDREQGGPTPELQDLPPPPESSLEADKPRLTKKRRKRRKEENPDNSVSEAPPQEEQGSVTRSDNQDAPVPSSSHDQPHARQLPEFHGDSDDAMLDMPAPPTLELPGNQATSRFTTSTNPLMLVWEEDITEEPLEDPQPHTLPPSHPHPSTTLTKDVIFVERKDGRGFLAQKRSAELAATRGGGGGGEDRNETRDISSCQFALYTHRAYHRLALSAHGLAAGISLWDCLVSGLLARQGHVELLQHYHTLALAAQAVYLALLSLTLVALLDRFDFARVERSCLEMLIRSPSQIILLIALLLVSSALVVTVSLAAIDERISLYPEQPSLWSDVLVAVNTSSSGFSVLPDPTTHPPVGEDGLAYAAAAAASSDGAGSQTLFSWLAVGVVRAVCCCGSWLAVVWTDRSQHRLEDYLRSCELDEAAAESTAN